MSFGSFVVSTAMNALLADHSVILYGAGGRMGPHVARAFAREGARLFLAGRTREPLEATAAAVVADGGAEPSVAIVDALDEAAVLAHVDAVVAESGRLDVSFNLVSRGDVQGTPLLDMPVDDFLAPLVTGARANFLTARAAARVMTRQGSGVVLMVTSGSGAVLKPSPQFQMGGTGPADAATESFLHYLAGEVGPSGVRVVGLWTAGVFYPDLMGAVSLMGSGPTVEQFADAAVWVASSRGSGVTASIVNVSHGVSAN
jgi:NAD(P)-dependent dehydrogenase (short-subunit alcohol dehydrogenase family)